MGVTSVDVFACDLSMHRPGFALLHCENNTITVRELSNVNNKYTRKKTHGQMLLEIARE